MAGINKLSGVFQIDRPIAGEMFELVYLNTMARKAEKIEQRYPCCFGAKMIADAQVNVPGKIEGLNRQIAASPKKRAMVYAECHLWTPDKTEREQGLRDHLIIDRMTPLDATNGVFFEIGRVALGKDHKDETQIPLRQLPNTNDFLAEFSLACDAPEATIVDGKVVYVPHTTWLQCVAYRINAEHAHEFCPKGSLIGVIGKLIYETWEGKNGKSPGAKFKLEVEALIFPEKAREAVDTAATATEFNDEETYTETPAASVPSTPPATEADDEWGKA
jgi:single-stranded DNA-binding protein